MPQDYEVPAFHLLATENKAMKWDYFVRHFTSPEQQAAHARGVPTDAGPRVLYPRAGTLGGCTAHNAMIFLAPHNSDWEHIARITDDPSWSPDAMRTIFADLENCHHRPLHRPMGLLGVSPSRHGWHGWLHVEKSVPNEAVGDPAIVRSILHAAWQAARASGQPLGTLARAIDTQLDPNDWELLCDNQVGLCYAPLTTHKHHRIGTRERLLDVQARYPERLVIVTDALATEIIFDESKHAVGVRYREGARLYRAFDPPSGHAGLEREIRASREVIVSGGTFSTPQLLMLSGIGPAETLAKFGISVRSELPVGKNLQDRYEVAVVSRMKQNWRALDGVDFRKGDGAYQKWASGKNGVYGTNGAIIAVTLKSALRRNRPDSDKLPPDLICLALLGDFRGYQPGHSANVRTERNSLTWCVLKAHTNNTAGEVSLLSKDPLMRPSVNFNYFEDGSDASGEDLEAVVDGIQFVRRLSAEIPGIKEEVHPGPSKASEDDLRHFVRTNAWGHHASCTCPIGTVLDGDFRVKGVTGLRVVDASVFPRIPGIFIVSAVYMIAEKAAAVIHRSAQAST